MIKKGKINWKLFVLFSITAVVIFSINSAYSDSVPTSIIITHPADVNDPRSIAIDSSDDIFVYQINGQIGKFDKFGNVINANFITVNSGSGIPQKISFDSSGNIYVLTGSGSSNFVKQYDSSGTLLDGSFISSILTQGFVAVDSSGNFYVGDIITTPNRIHKYDSSGNLIDFFFIEFLQRSLSMAFDSSDNIYVVEQLANRVSKYDSTGNLLNVNFITGLSFPNSIAIDSSDLIYVASSGTQQVRQYDSSGTLIDVNFIDSLNFPSSIDFDSSDNIYVSDRNIGILAGIVAPLDSDGDGLTDDDEINIHGTDPNDPDTDGDALEDRWEIVGLNANGTFPATSEDADLVLEGADPLFKDIYVEIDFWEFHKPRQTSIDNVKDSFKNSPVSNPNGTFGIALHVDIDEQIDHDVDDAWFFDIVNDNWPEYDASKNDNFMTFDQRADPNNLAIKEAKMKTYRYGVFIHQIAIPDGFSGQVLVGNSGISEGNATANPREGGNDFVVSLGASFWGLNDTGTHNVGTVEEQAGTFMHELGHTMALGHGGIDDENCKSNYFSVMNYFFQIPDPNDSTNFPLDYSSVPLLTLDEDGNLDEGLGVPSSVDRKVFYGVPDLRAATTNNPINWNNNFFFFIPIIDPIPVSANINSVTEFPGCSGSVPPLNDPFTELIGFDDWSNLIFDFTQSSFFNDGVHPSQTQINEITDEEAQAFRDFKSSLNTISPIMDGFLTQGSAKDNEGANPILRIISSDKNRPVIEFDQNAIELAGTGRNSLDSATLRLFVTENGNNWGPEGRSISAFKLLEIWEEGNGWNVGNNISGDGTGVTWNCAIDNDISNNQDDCATQWNGGNFDTAPTDTVLITNSVVGQFIEFDVTADVQVFLDGTVTNHGWLITKSAGAKNGAISFASKEAASNPPELVLIFQ